MSSSSMCCACGLLHDRQEIVPDNRDPPNASSGGAVRLSPPPNDQGNPAAARNLGFVNTPDSPLRLTALFGNESLGANDPNDAGKLRRAHLLQTGYLDNLAVDSFSFAVKSLTDMRSELLLPTCRNSSLPFPSNTTSAG